MVLYILYADCGDGLWYMGNARMGSRAVKLLLENNLVKYSVNKIFVSKDADTKLTLRYLQRILMAEYSFHPTCQFSPLQIG